jgi:ATP-dependent Clp protease ATP-binding subunit ClpC
VDKFERYTEKARRAVFFGRYEASVYGTPEIDTRCLLMGILREDRDLMARLLPERAHELCRLWRDVEASFPKTARRAPTNLDLPLAIQQNACLRLPRKRQNGGITSALNRGTCCWASLSIGGQKPPA